jgi:hypothetical protein
MLSAGGALVLASTACAQIAPEPRVRVPAVIQPVTAGQFKPAQWYWEIRHRCWASWRGRSTQR